MGRGAWSRTGAFRTPVGGHGDATVIRALAIKSAVYHARLRSRREGMDREVYPKEGGTAGAAAWQTRPSLPHLGSEGFLFLGHERIRQTLGT